MSLVTWTEFAAVPGHMPRQLLDYWVHGEGAAKIRWGTPGDFKRCVTQLRKYFPRNPEGLCNRLHTRALGVPPGQEHGLVADAAGDDAPVAEELAMFPTKKMWRGRLAPIGVPTGDRRKFEVGAIGHRDLPLPLLYQLQTNEGHMQSVVVARILGIEITDDEAYGYGDWLDTEHTAAAQERLASGVGGVSVDLDDVEFELRVPGTGTKWLAAEQCSDETGECANHEFVVTKGRIAAATIVAIPAFAEAKLEMYEGIDEEGLLAAFDEMPLAEEDDSDCGCGMSASAIQAYCTPVGGVTAAVTSFTPPAAVFANPEFTALTGITLDDTTYPGYITIKGHMGDWRVNHMGLPNQSLPRSRSGYAYFHLSPIYTAEGEEVYVGKLLYGGKHPSMQAGLAAATQHYDDTSKTAAFVVAGEDQYGIWISGVLAPGLDDETKLGIMTSPPSGDWRYVGRDLEMIAVLAVNVPGFPVVRARAEQGRVRALVASAGPMPVQAALTNVGVQMDVPLSLLVPQVTTLASGAGVNITIDPAVLAPYVAEQIRARERAARAEAAGAVFRAELEREQARIAALRSVFS